MTCSEVRSQLSAYIDGRLNQEARRKVDVHLLECEACRSELATLQTSVRMVRSLGRIRWERPAPKDQYKE